jgi:hypothetical protein
MQNMTDSRYGAWDYDELTHEKDSIVLSVPDDFGVALDALMTVELGIPTILVQGVEDMSGNSLWSGEARFTDPDALIKWLDERYLRIAL